MSIKTATFSMGCFWGPDALFGCMPEVIRTRVGYAGGTLNNPTYHNLGNHIETIQIDYDLKATGFADLLDIFWYHHNPTVSAKRQYMSAIFYHDEEQLNIATMTKKFQEARLRQPIHTQILPFKNFYIAEDYHQKFYLRQVPELEQEFLKKFPDVEDFINATATARVNGYVAGYGRQDDLNKEIESYGLSASGKELLLTLFAQRK